MAGMKGRKSPPKKRKKRAVPRRGLGTGMAESAAESIRARKRRRRRLMDEI